MIELEQAEKSSNVENSCIEAIVSFDERGQLVIPKDLRKKYQLQAGEKFALISCNDQEGKLCCFTLIKTDRLNGIVNQFLGPAMQSILKK